MPVRVRCENCGKILNAPDRARGKAVKCPGCANAVRVPAAPRKRKVAAENPSSSTMLIANLDLDKLEDTESRVCQRCGTSVTDDDFECPQCGANLETGIVSEKKRREMARRGPDPRQYYATLRSDAWQFLRDNRSLAVRTSIYTVVFSLLCVWCVSMALTCKTWPPRTFWWFFAAVTGLAAPGWTWFLHNTIISATLEKKRKLKKVNFDFFQSAALGIKLLLWFIAIGAPFIVLAVVFAFLKIPILAVTGVGLGLLMALLLFPIAMAHMSMPVTYRGWLLTSLFPTFAKTAGPTLYWCLFFVITMMPEFVLLGVIGGVSGPKLFAYGKALRHNADVTFAMEYQLRTGYEPTQEISNKASEMLLPADFRVLILPGALWLVASGLFGFVAVFNMRTNGLFAYYFKPALDLITLEKQVKYVPKTDTGEEVVEQPSTASQAMIIAALGTLAIFMWGYQMEKTLIGLMLALASVALLWAPLIGVWRLFEMSGEKGGIAIVPIYNVIVGARLASKKDNWTILMLSLLLVAMQFLVPAAIAFLYLSGDGIVFLYFSG